jgi:hypothetical protein
MKSSLRAAALLALSLSAPLAASAEEGMWTFNRFPTAHYEKSTGAQLDAKRLDHLRASSIRVSAGGSASFVSPDGLVLTNHHVASDCIEQVSTPKADYIKRGFAAKSRDKELVCPGLELHGLTRITDVTAQVRKATEGLDDAKAGEARRAEIARLEKACQTSEAVHCEVVKLYNGGVWDLYEYKRYTDVRLVWAPELGIAFFGGDPDNFMFPRYDLDAALLRAYEGGKPAKSPDFFALPPAGSKLAEGDVVLVTGNPGSTSRLNTVAQTENWRDFGLVPRLMYLSEIRGALVEYARRGKEQARHSQGLFFGVENSLKSFRGEADALFGGAVLEQVRVAERAFKERALANKATGPKVMQAFADIERAMGLARALRTRYDMLERGRGFNSDLFSSARTLLRASVELQKPDAERLSGYHDSNLPGLKNQLGSASPVYAEFEIFRLTFALTKLRELLGADDPIVKAVLGKDSPEQLATRVVRGSKLADPKQRLRLLDGGAAAVQAAKDPMIALAAVVDAEARAVRKRMEDEVDAVVTRAHETIQAARFEIYGTTQYPDATFTPRVNWGKVRGWTEPSGRVVTPFTTFGGAFERHTGAEPFALPKSWLDAKPRLALDASFNFSSDNDIIGGNSGSPALDAQGRLIGLVFDGNIHSLGGDYGFDTALNRAVFVDARAIVHALDVVYGQADLLRELGATPPATAK